MTAQLSRERLLALLCDFEGAAKDARDIGDDMYTQECEDTASIIREVLQHRQAGMDSEPVAYLYSASFERGHVEGELTDAPGCDMPVYSATPGPAPVAVPDEWRMMCGDWRDETVSIHDVSGLIVSGVDANVAGVIVEAHNAFRAAMLKAGPVTGWIKCSEQMPPLNNGQMWIYSPTRGVQFMFALAASGEYYDTCDSEEDITDATHWMPIVIPAAPEQEV